MQAGCPRRGGRRNARETPISPFAGLADAGSHYPSAVDSPSARARAGAGARPYGPNMFSQSLSHRTGLVAIYSRNACNSRSLRRMCA